MTFSQNVSWHSPMHSTKTKIQTLMKPPFTEMAKSAMLSGKGPWAAEMMAMMVAKSGPIKDSAVTSASGISPTP